MIDLKETAALGHDALSIGACAMFALDLGQMTQVMPFNGQNDAVSGALGIALPKPNRVHSKGDMRIQWFGRATYLVFGPVTRLDGIAAYTDQSNGWVGVTLEGEGAEDVLARLVPLDVRRATFKKGHTVRTMIQHMTGAVTRTGPHHFTLMVMRSMGQTLWHDVQTAMENVASR